MRNVLIVLSGPSGVGKGTIAKLITERNKNVSLSISCTTRKPRDGETHGKEYFFISKDEFSSKIGENGFLEYSEHFENFYGTPKDFVLEKLVDNDVLLEIDVNGARYAGVAPSGKVLVDGYGVGDVGNIVLRDRRHLAQDGLIVVVASVDVEAGLLLSEPDIISRGFVYVRESEELMDEIRQLITEAITDRLERSDRVDRMELKTCVKDTLSKYLYSKTKRKPMVLPVIMNV